MLTTITNRLTVELCCWTYSCKTLHQHKKTFKLVIGLSNSFTSELFTYEQLSKSHQCYSSIVPEMDQIFQGSP